MFRKDGKELQILGEGGAACAPIIRTRLVLPPLRVGCESVDEGDDDVLDVDGGLEFGAGFEEGVEGGEVELVGKDLDDAFHKVLLRYGVTTRDHLLQQARQHALQSNNSTQLKNWEEIYYNYKPYIGE